MTDTYTFWSLDTPAGPILLTPCLHPDSNQERPDVPLGRTCETHGRTWYWCVDLEQIWCDGGPPDYDHHGGRFVAEVDD